MKTVNHTYTMHMNNISDYLVYVLDDNGDWGYSREGIGIFEGRVFVVDLNDTGEEVRRINFVEESMQVHDVLAAGKSTGRYIQCPAGTFYYNWDADGDVQIDNAFNMLVGI